MSRPPLKSRLKTLALWGTGLLRRREAAQVGACVVMYHGVVPTIDDPILDQFAVSEDVFRAHLRHLRRSCAPIPLDELLQTLHSGGAIDRRWVVVTLDDALLTQTERAAALLAEQNIPWSLAVPAGLIGTGRTIWSYELRFLLLRCWSRPTVPMPFGPTKELPAATREQRLAAVNHLRAAIDREPLTTNPVAVVAALVEAHGEQRFREELERYGRFTLADWPRLRTLADAGVEMLVHGHRHLPQRAWLSPADREEEIVTARTILQQRLNVSPRGFVFPHGVVSQPALDTLAASGYECALTTRPLRVTGASKLLELPRINAEFDLLTLRRGMLV